MESILRGSPAVSAAATGRIAVPTIHLTSSDQRDEALFGCWLALARIKVLEIWVDQLDIEEELSGSPSSNLTLMCKRDMHRIEALAAVPCGKLVGYFVGDYNCCHAFVFGMRFRSGMP